MVSLPEEAREAVCGDLYDAQSGSGGFVIQRSGRDLFLKPLRAAGASYMSCPVSGSYISPSP